MNQTTGEDDETTEFCLKPVTGSLCYGNSGGPSAMKIEDKFVQGKTIILIIILENILWRLWHCKRLVNS